MSKTFRELYISGDSLDSVIETLTNIRDEATATGWRDLSLQIEASSDCDSYGCFYSTLNIWISGTPPVKLDWSDVK